MEKISFRLCTNESCCPIVEMDGNNVKISDDYGGSVQLTKGEVELLVKKFAELEKQ